ncbi:MAG: Hsp70 family protein [Alphaproteobacteria bacterium]
MAETSCGIDFGTTNTSAAFANNKKQPLLVNVEGNATSTPSTIFFSAQKHDVSFGREALSRYMGGEHGRFMRSLKRVLGSNLMRTGTQINTKTIKFDQILGLYLKNIKSKIDLQAQDNVENVIMGRPVHFRDNDEKGDTQAQEELKSIAKSVGFKNIEFQFEPIAAAFAHEAKLSKEELACVIDIGGGTSDFSIIKVGNNLTSKTNRKDDILANTGVRIGGNDFDKDLSLKTFMPELGKNTTYGKNNQYEKELPVPTSHFFDLSEWSSINSLYNYKTLNFVKKILFQSNDIDKYGRLVDVIENEQGHALLNKVEETKINLTNNLEANVLLNFLSNTPSVHSTKENFEDAIFNNLQKVSNSVNECLMQAQTKPEKIGLIILTGGSTEIPFVKETLCAHFPNAKLSAENKFSSVGLGLAYDGMRKF